MPGLYIYRENPLSEDPSKLEKVCIPPLSQFMRNEGLALELPFIRRPLDHKYPDKKVETLPIPLRGATFDPVVMHRDKTVLETGEISIVNFLAKLTIAGFQVHEDAAEARFEQSRMDNKNIIDALEKRLKETGLLKTRLKHVSAALYTRPHKSNRTFDAATLEKLFASYLNIGKNSASVIATAMAEHLLAHAYGWEAEDEPITPEKRAEALLNAIGNPITVDQLLGLSDRPAPGLSITAFKPEFCTLSYTAPDNEESAPDRLQTGDALFEAALSTAAYKADDHAAAVEVMISKSPTYKGLSWLLNTTRGIGLFAYGQLEDVAQLFGAPVAVIAILQADARKIIRDWSGSVGALHELRYHIGGSLKSFATKYFSRLEELSETCEQLERLFQNVSLPETLFDASSNRAFDGTGFTASDLKKQWNDAAHGVRQLGRSIKTLEGKAEEPATASVVIEFERPMDRVRELFGSLRLVLNNLLNWTKDVEAAEKKGRGDQVREGRAALDAINIPKSLVHQIGFKGWPSTDADQGSTEVSEEEDNSASKIELPRLPRRLSSEQFTCEKLETTRVSLDAAIKHAQSLAKWLIEGQSLADAMLANFEAQDIRHLQNRRQDYTAETIQGQARRHLLHMWFRFWASLSRPSIDYAQAKLVELALGNSDDPKNKETTGWPEKAHRFMQAGQGNLWVSMFATRKRKAYGMGSQRLLEIDLNKLLSEMTQWLTEQYQVKQFDTAVVDYHALQAKLLEFAATHTDKEVTPSDLEITKWPLTVTLRPAEKAALQTTGAMARRDVARIAGRLAVSIRDAASLIHRARHLDSATFSPVEQLQKIAYVSKFTTETGEERLWCPPMRLWNTDTPVSLVLRNLMVERQPIAVRALFGDIREQMKTAKGDDAFALRKLLADMPHAWGFATALTGLRGGQDVAPDSVLMIGKEQNLTSMARNRALFPMVLTPARANILDECLRGDRQLMPGNLTFRYHYDKTQNYEPMARLTEIHIPTAKAAAEVAERERSPYFDRLIGIDLGERGVGFCVRDVSNEQCPVVERGMVPIPAIRNLIKATRTYRQRHQKKLSIRTSHVDFSEMRQAVAGNVIAVIKYLMYHYKALPVFEMDLSNLNAGQKQLSHVYNAVTDAFISRKVPTVDKVRANTWRGYSITHPYLNRVDINPSTKLPVAKDFKLFPGTGVKAAFTSQICSGCGVNPIKRLRQEKSEKFFLDENGCLHLSDVTFQVFKTSSINGALAGTGRLVPLSNYVISKSELIVHLKNNQLRVGPAGKGSKDTSQSRYWCVNVDCEHHNPNNLLHADMNAADNIVRRACDKLIRK